MQALDEFIVQPWREWPFQREEDPDETGVYVYDIEDPWDTAVEVALGEDELAVAMLDLEAKECTGGENSELKGVSDGDYVNRECGREGAAGYAVVSRGASVADAGGGRSAH